LTWHLLYLLSSLLQTAIARRGRQPDQHRAVSGARQQPVRRAAWNAGEWLLKRFGTIPPFQNNFPRIIKLALKLYF
jgi:hypothetical protein